MPYKSTVDVYTHPAVEKFCKRLRELSHAERHREGLEGLDAEQAFEYVMNSIAMEVEGDPYPPAGSSGIGDDE